MSEETTNSQEAEELFPLSELPHSQWLVDNNEFVNANVLSKDIKNKMRAIPLLYSKYKDATDEDSAANCLDKVKKLSYTIADMMQTWREDIEYKETEAPEVKPKNKTQMQPETATQKAPEEVSGVQIIDGKPVTAEQKAKEDAEKAAQQQQASETKKDEEKPKNSAGKSVLTVLGIAALAFLGIKFLGRK